MRITYKTTSDSDLKDIVKNSISISEVIRKCGGRPAGGTFQYFKSRMSKLNLDTTHFLGQAAHTGFRHTGISKKKHWSIVLVKRKTHDRERTNVFRRAYREYCEEKHIPIECVDCKNVGEWIGKSMKLQISHKDDNRSNNVPSNLEWLCPNCHSVKTKY